MIRAPGWAALCTAVAALTLLAATPAPAPPPPPKPVVWKTKLHSEFVVAVNKRGQVSRIISGKPSSDKQYNLHTGGNALQMYIRTPDGKAIPGRYRVTYDYNPKTEKIHRDVELVGAGGVDPNAEGAVNVMIDDVKQRNKRAASPGPGGTAEMTPGPQPTGKLHLPPLQQILKSPAP